MKAKKKKTSQKRKPSKASLRLASGPNVQPKNPFETHLKVNSKTNTRGPTTLYIDSDWAASTSSLYNEYDFERFPAIVMTE